MAIGIQAFLLPFLAERQDNHFDIPPMDALDGVDNGHYISCSSVATHGGPNNVGLFTESYEVIDLRICWRFRYLSMYYA